MGAIETGLSALRAAGTRMDAAASNIARASVPDALPLRADAVAAADGGVEASLSASDGDRIDLSGEAIDLLQAKRDYAVNARVIRRVGEMQSSLFDVLA